MACVVHFCLGPTVVYTNHVGYSPLCSLNQLQFAFTRSAPSVEESRSQPGSNKGSAAEARGQRHRSARPCSAGRGVVGQKSGTVS